MNSTSFLTSESGAVTVDWVVLTAALVGLGLATMAVVSSGVEDLSGDIDTQLQEDNIIRTAFSGLGASTESILEANSSGSFATLQNEALGLSNADLTTRIGTERGLADSEASTLSTFTGLAAADWNNVSAGERTALDNAGYTGVTDQASFDAQQSAYQGNFDLANATASVFEDEATQRGN